MPRFSANLSLLWPSLEPYDRFAAAAAAGFRAVEMQFVHALDPDRLAGALRAHDLQMVLFNPWPGDWAAGERGLLCLSGREDELLEGVRGAVELAARLGVRRLNTLVGVLPPGVSREEGGRTAVANLRRLADVAEPAGVVLVVEAINSVDVPGYAADTVERAAALVREVDRPAVRLLLDQYHVGMGGGDALAALQAHRGLVAHVQVADVPGRHQPGTGRQPIPAFLAELDRLGYDGHVGLEYVPLGSTEQSLDWLPRAARA